MKRKEGAFLIALTATMIGVLGLVSLPLQSAREAGGPTLSTAPASNTSTTLSEGPLVFVSPTSEQGLQLRVVLNSSAIPTNGTLGAQISVYNTLDKNVSVTVTQDQQINAWNGRDFLLCGWNGEGNLVGFAVFKGDVAATNLSEAGQQLELDPQLLPYIVMGCPSEESFPANATFFPESDRVSYAYGVSASVDPKTLSCSYTEVESQCAGAGLVGFWNDSVSSSGNLGFNSPAFSYFPPGEYTIVATDQWNQTVYANFFVQPPNTSSSSIEPGAAEVTTVVATITVTTTLTTQASQATTIYAQPTSNCTIMPITVTTTTTTTVGPIPPATTTTTTVTSTSTSYTQTVTVTSCTYSLQTVTSTVTTTTANP